MGRKCASIHFRSDTPEKLMPKLKRQFNKKQEDDKEIALINFIEALAQKKMDNMADENEKAEVQSNLKMFRHGLKNHIGGNEKAVILVQEHFVSLYWRDQIRVDNLDKTLYQYGSKLKVPILGVAVYDDNNFIIQAARNIGNDNAESCMGSYWFDENDIKPVDASEICRILEADFLLNALMETLSLEDGELMAESFTSKTRLPIYLDSIICSHAGILKLEQWSGADVFRII